MTFFFSGDFPVLLNICVIVFFFFSENFKLANKKGTLSMANAGPVRLFLH